MEFLFTDLLRVIRDVAIVILALETILVGLVVLFLLLQIWKLVTAIRKHLDKLVGQASEVLTTSADTMRNVRGTASFVSEHAARPVIEVLSVLTAAAQFARTAFTTQDGNSKRPDR